MASADMPPGLDVVTTSPGAKGRHRASAPAVRGAWPVQADTGAEQFTRFATEYAAQHPDRTISILQAGCTTAGAELDLAAVRASGADLVVSHADDDCPAAREAAERRPELRSATLAELRQLPLAPRSLDIVQCSMLLHRIGNAELVLSRLVGALRPGGLLLLTTPDRLSATGALDRMLPQFARVMAWRLAMPGQPGPFPARYEPIASARGVEAFAARHGLVIAHRQARRAVSERMAAAAVARTLVAWLSGGRFTSSHDELHYVIRKPEDPDARVISGETVVH
ncbi:MAG TPA: methyltransferase domain-containing protein [Streptosporangiaceae bacterium]|nr:methyltransferase domain-containing protein [Streptosporangiaceae bacterium]